MSIKKACTDYLNQINIVGSRGIAPAFFGRGGTYKTLGAATVARMIQDLAHVQVAFLSASVELQRLEGLRFAESSLVRITQLSRVSFLVVDDFDAAPPQSWQAQRLVELAEARYGNLLPTLWTCNLTVSRSDQTAITNRYGQAFARRVWEGSEGFRVIAR